MAKAHIDYAIRKPKIVSGDTVRIMECRPMSKDKRWRLIEIVEKAK